ncbi:hypothetical protein BDV3_003410 [Batrachochytrium dendrobatidis]|uniref:Tyrosinase copper-binding domain-containing protein n=1 Tax=Batrachochytrium dendrobatidis (strain JEL423) TaxID=403673 RepID=A0A177WCF2_BATDL|nr:hypothetical protein O5D80_003960 [Batrachochytrium dendrobatidis]KAK5669242.1 hypothetical protein QVD99_003652 [Batrachochytrium dendrobatidis]OAJ37777.1 hypothetical protein BDEG_21769 [Batrachochytrium dendrobatidis JEL423]
MLFSSILALAIAIPSALVAGTCTNPLIRREWRELTENQQIDYLNAVICLKMAPSKLGPTINSPSRYDDVSRTHFRALDIAHGSAIFLPWHRLFLSTYEKVLRTECGYTGTLPYWDWTVDSQAPESSSLWSEWSFGGDGDSSTQDNCITDGPFMYFYSEFAFEACLSRTIGGNLGRTVNFYTPEAIFRMVSTTKTYDAFRHSIEEGPHNNVHVGVGGDMGIVSMSANDPIFMLHHANVDRMWTIWQSLNPKLANTYGGFNSDGSPARPTDPISVYGLTISPVYKVSDMFSTTSDAPLCYKYSNSIMPGISSTGRQLQKRNYLLEVDQSCNATEIATAPNAYTHGVSKNWTPHSLDRENKRKVRCASRTPEHFALQMKYDKATMKRMRKSENDHCAFTNYINARYPNYQSPCSLNNVEKQTFVPMSDADVAENNLIYASMINDYHSSIGK